MHRMETSETHKLPAAIRPPPTASRSQRTRHSAPCMAVVLIVALPSASFSLQQLLQLQDSKRSSLDISHSQFKSHLERLLFKMSVLNKLLQYYKKPPANDQSPKPSQHGGHNEHLILKLDPVSSEDGLMKSETHCSNSPTMSEFFYAILNHDWAQKCFVVTSNGL